MPHTAESLVTQWDQIPPRMQRAIGQIVDACVTQHPTSVAETLDDFATRKELGAELVATGKSTEMSLEWDLRHREENGLSPHVIKVGNKLLINRAGYLRWKLGSK